MKYEEIMDQVEVTPTMRKKVHRTLFYGSCAAAALSSPN